MGVKKKKNRETLLPKASPLDLCFVFVPGPSLSKLYTFSLFSVLQNTNILYTFNLLHDQESEEGDRPGHDALLCGGRLLHLQHPGPGGQHSGGKSEIIFKKFN